MGKKQNKEKTDMKGIYNDVMDRLIAGTSVSMIRDGDAMSITFPFLDRHNDYISIFVGRDGDGFVVADDGNSICLSDDDNIWACSQAFMDSFCNSVFPAGCKVKHSRGFGFYCEVSQENVAKAVVAMLAFLIQVAGLQNFDSIVRAAAKGGKAGRR